MKILAIENPAVLAPVVAAVPSGRHWKAQLSLGFARDKDVTRLVERVHQGPLRVQKPLYPEGDTICHAILIHPPGGVVGGDELAINAAVQAEAHALITTPGAAKWYKANGHASQQQVKLEVGAGAVLEWLPQETIFFNASQVRLEQTVSLAADASYLGWEILCFGRSASGETFNQGKIQQSTTVRRGGKLIWFEQGSISGEPAAMQHPLLLAGATVCATMLATGKSVSPAIIQSVRDNAVLAANGSGQSGVTQVKQMIVVRYIGNSSEVARQVMFSAWRTLRPALLGCEASLPRIWNT